MLTQTQHHALEQVQPQNQELERSLLGYLLLSPNAIDAIGELLTPDAFYVKRHGIVYAAMDHLWRSMQPTEPTLVAARLADENVLKGVGGTEFLLELQQAAQPSINIEQYAQEVRRYYLLRQLIAASEQVSQIGHDASAPVEESFRKVEQLIFRVTQQGSSIVDFVTPAEAAAGFAIRVQELSESGEIPGLATGFHDLDAMTNGLKGGELAFVVGRPGAGKSAFAQHIADAITANKDRPVSAAYFSQEMGIDQLLTRNAARVASVDATRIRAGRLGDSEWGPMGQAINKMAVNSRLHICQQRGLSIEDIAAKSRRLSTELAQTAPLKILFVDHMHLLSHSKRDELTGLTHITKAAKTLAGELNVAVVMLAQLSRSCEGRNDKRPMLSDIRASGSAEQDADLVIGLYRDEYYNPNSPDRGVAEVIILKQREGPVGTVKLLFEPQFVRFRNMAKGRYE